jgi:hypothetical protein
VLGYAHAPSGATCGVKGHSKSTAGIGLLGWSEGGATGVLGWSGGPALPPAPVKTGVYGRATQDANARGVWGETTAGRGVSGVATTGTGVYATATTGLALRAVGRVKLDKCAGVGAIPAGSKSLIVTPGIDLVTTSAVVATLQGSAGTETTTVSRVIVNPATNQFTIHLTAKATQNVTVAWHVFG